MEAAMQRELHDEPGRPPDDRADHQILFSEMLDRVKEVAHEIDERVHHALEVASTSET